ncbi:MAG: GTPase Era [Paludibacteraceae bacterium]|jgi:GTPase|nr:GTPase Era [Paludibacteraceae bacterium]HOH95761.1 GTPase Era [Candidatus Enterocola sp.]HPG55302.1 GTPase Era [Candidatus Enterocola sp.]
MHKAGFVNIIGNPNVGKSTLMNALVGERISIITSKSQTTRHRIMGIVNGDDFQIVYSDTPGVLKPHYRLQESMLEASQSALSDADVLLYVTDTFETYDKNSEFLEKTKRSGVPTFVIINKIDLLPSQEALENLVEKWKSVLPDAIIIPVCALERFNLDQLLKQILALLPESPPYFDKDALTDRPARFFVTEIIREKILETYDKEVPYSTEVVVEKFQEDEKLIRINAMIIVERDSQKGIIIGKGGSMLKKVGMAARTEIEAFLEKKVFLELYVKVEKDWRNKDKQLKSFGYNIVQP